MKSSNTGYKPLLKVTALGAATVPFVSPLAHVQAAQPAQATVTVQAGGSGTKISPDLFGIFFEDINYSADGGLYAELIQNRSFEYSAQDNAAWNPLTSWELVTRGDGKGSVTVEKAQALNTNNPQYAVLSVEQGGSGVGLMNAGFDGIVLKAGEKYDLSFFARRISDGPLPLVVRLESKTGTVYGEARFTNPTKDWAKYSATITPNASDPSARLVIQTTGVGKVALDMISLFPRKTFRNRPNGLRPDLAQVIADLHPKFVRFPGGCLAHGDGLRNIYHWKNTIGPIETRKGQPNIWRYHQTAGLGYFEYFQFCEDIGAKALPVVAAGVSCQNSNHKPGTGQESIPMEQMGQYVQDVLDLVEYANGPVTSKWGAKRAAAGHPKPFNLQYLGVGNEDHITPEFKVRFEMISKAVRAKYPKLTVIGTVGPAPSGFDFNEGWKVADQLKLDVVDEHYYQQPDWFLNNLTRYDSYNRSKSKVYLGEYASRGNTLFNALSEAAYMAALERNGDIVHLASYAPLLAKTGRTQWNPDLIYFDNTSILPSVNYYVQQLYGQNAGDTYLSNTVSYKAAVVEENPIAKPVGVFVGTWNTQAQFDDVSLQSGTTPILNESFETSAAGWNGAANNWTVKDGVYSQNSNAQPALSNATGAQVNVVDGKPVYTYSLRARKTGGAEGFLIGFGATDSENYYWWNLGGWGNKSHGIERRQDGSSRTVGAVVPGTIELNRWYDIKIVVNGQRIQGFLDGKLIQDVTDNSKPATENLFASSVKDTKTGDIILKLVNVSPNAVQSTVKLDGSGKIRPVATKTVLSGDIKARNSFGNPNNLIPQSASLPVGKSFTYEAPANSFTVIRLKTR